MALVLDQRVLNSWVVVHKLLCLSGFHHLLLPQTNQECVNLIIWYYFSASMYYQNCSVIFSLTILSAFLSGPNPTVLFDLSQVYVFVHFREYRSNLLWTWYNVYKNWLFDPEVPVSKAKLTWRRPKTNQLQLTGQAGRSLWLNVMCGLPDDIQWWNVFAFCHEIWTST